MNRSNGSATSAAIVTRRPALMLDVVARRGRWVAFAAGLALAAAFAPASLAVLSIACPALLILLWQDVTTREAAWRGGLFTGGTFLAGTYWLYHSVHEIGHAPLPVAIFLMLGLVAIMGFYSAAMGWLVARYAPRAGAARWMLIIPAGWILVEWLRGSRLRKEDALLIFSVGGGNLEKNVSPNLVTALQLAKQVGARVIGVVGKDGGYTAKVADACVIVPTVNPANVTPHTEAFQSVVAHLLVSHPALQTTRAKWESTR